MPIQTVSKPRWDISHVLWLRSELPGRLFQANVVIVNDFTTHYEVSEARQQQLEKVTTLTIEMFLYGALVTSEYTPSLYSIIFLRPDLPPVAAMFSHNRRADDHPSGSKPQTVK